MVQKNGVRGKFGDEEVAQKNRKRGVDTEIREEARVGAQKWEKGLIWVLDKVRNTVFKFLQRIPDKLSDKLFGGSEVRTSF